jgi:hypothetical protein
MNFANQYNLIEYLKSKYYISDNLSKYLYENNYTSPYSLINIKPGFNFLKGDISILCIFNELTHDDCDEIINHINSKNNINDELELDVISYFKKKYLISNDLECYLLDNNYTSPYSIKYIIYEDGDLKLGDENMITIFHELTIDECANIISIIKHNKTIMDIDT